MKEKPAKPERIEKTPEEKFQSFWFVWNILEDVLLIVAGALAIVLGILSKDNEGVLANDNQVIINIILYSVAGFVILDGFLRTAMLVKNYKKSETSAYLVGGFEITVGIVLMIMGAQTFFSLIINFLGVFLIVMGAMLLFVSICAIAKKIESRFMPVLEVLFGAILVGFGIALMIIYHAGEMSLRNRVSFILIGIILAIAGLAMLIGLLVGRKKKNSDDKKLAKAEARYKEQLENKNGEEVNVEIIGPEETKETKPKKWHWGKNKETEPKAIEEKITED